MFWLTIVNLAASTVFSCYIYSINKSSLIKGIDSKLQAAAQAVPLLLAADYHDRLAANAPGSQQDYYRAMQLLTDYATKADVFYVYTFLYGDDKKFLTASTSLSDKDLRDYNIPPTFPAQPGWPAEVSRTPNDGIPQLLEPYDAAADYFEVVASQQIKVFENADEFGSWRSYLLPLKTPGGRTYVAGADVETSFIRGELRRSVFNAVLIGLALFIATTAICYGISNVISRDLAGVAAETLKISQFRLNEGNLQSSAIAEVDRLIRSVEDMKVSLRSFGKYVPTALVRELISSGQEARLGGQAAELTVFFSDIADFTSISESMKPLDLVNHIGDYLGELSHIILSEKGTVDKYIGDSIMAFWGAPISQEDHALAGCRTALACQRKLVALCESWQADGKPPLHTRIGICSGPLVVGNMGSENRLNYTVIGDTVNLASRLEGLNKYYGTRIIIGESTYAIVKDHMLTRPIDRVSVKGKSQGTLVYELLDDAATATPEARVFASDFAAALSAYFACQWAAAAEIFSSLQQKYPDDRPTALLLARIREFQANPPPAGWDGVYKMMSK